MPNIPQQRIVVGVDGSERSLAAVDLAAAEAALHHLPLHLISAGPDLGRPGVAPVAGHEITLAAVLSRVQDAWPGLTATAQNVTGDPVGLLVEASRTASLLVVGRRHTGAPPTGGVSAQVAAHALCPTVMVPSQSPPLFTSPVLLALGMTADDDQPAIGFAFAEAALRQVPLLAVHVWAGVPAAAVGQVSPFRYDLRQARAAADHQIEEVLAPWSQKYPSVTVERMPLYDVDPARTLLDAGWLAGLVVVGANRFHANSSQLLGTVTRKLLTRSTRPVAVLRSIH